LPTTKTFAPSVRVDDWWPQWRGETIAIIGSGPSAKKAGVDRLQYRTRVIAINESWQLAPWADMIYACDGNWWKLHDGLKRFKGLKVTYDTQACDLYRDLHRIEIPDRKSDELLLEPLGYVGAGGNSGFQALNLAVQLGGKRILLVGYDMRVDLGEHWHPRHYPPLSNPHPNDNLPRWRAALDKAHGFLAQHGIEVVNCSPVSLLKAYPKMTIEEALNGIAAVERVGA
jgi:hypothetical protein